MIAAARKTLAAAAVLSILLLVPSAFGNIDDARRLQFYHTHTQETLEVTYYFNGRYKADALDRINDFLSDWRNGAVQPMDPALMDILWDIQQAAGVEGTYEVISAYRSPETNEMLRTRSKGVAKSSQHLHGKAIDVRLRGLETRILRDTALQLERGGVGYYAQSDFVHVDTGRVRRW